MSAVPFTKYHGLGNDFIVIDLRLTSAPLDGSMAARLCERRFGIGADGILAILPSAQPNTDARLRILNADGSEAEMCGNGIRCVAKYLYDRCPSLHKPLIRIETGAGVLACQIEAVGDQADTISVEMGRPRLEPADIPVASERIEFSLALAQRTFTITAVSMGNPHAVTFVTDESASLRSLAEHYGPLLENHPAFPKKTNAEFARCSSRGEIELVVWERGCGITLACGTGACATAVAACLTGRADADQELTIRLLGGPLAVTVLRGYSGVTMRGPARLVFDGQVDLQRSA